MREIKFRGKNDLDGWVYGDYIRVASKYKKENIFHYITSNFFEQFEIHEESLGQYTGLKDKNGREIYEGDLIRKKFNDRAIGEFYAVGQVVFGMWYAGFTVPYQYNGYHKLERLSSDMDKDGWVVASRDMEVIGNIHENPELLDKVK